MRAWFNIRHHQGPCDGEAAIIACMDFKCPTLLETADVRKALGADPSLIARYDRLLVALYVQDNPRLRGVGTLPLTEV